MYYYTVCSNTVVLNVIMSYSRNTQKQSCRGSGVVDKSVRLACGRLFVQIPTATDLSDKGSASSTANRSARKCECHGSLEMTIITGCPVSR